MIIEIGTHPISPNNRTIGACLPTPRKLLIKFFFNLLRKLVKGSEAPDKATIFNNL